MQVGNQGVSVLPCAVLLVFGVVKAVVGEDDFGVVAVAAEWVVGGFGGGGQIAACLVILGLRQAERVQRGDDVFVLACALGLVLGLGAVFWGDV